MRKNYFIAKIYRQITIEKIEKKCLLLGSKYNYNPHYLLTYRFFSSLFILIILFTLPYGFIISPIITIIYYILLEYFFLDNRIIKRKEKIEKEALYFFEVLSLTLNTGKNLTVSLDMTTKTIKNDLSYEFRCVLEENKVGKSLIESLKDMKQRIPSESVNSVIINLIESNKYGNNIIETLNSQISYLNEKKLQDTKGYIATLPIKISVISVVFFIPIMLLIVLGPVIIKVLIG